MLIKLFLGFFKIGLIGYGGGPAVIPLVEREFVVKYKLISEDEIIELLGICNMLPGPIITKMVAVIGYRNKGIVGACVSVFALLLPSSLMLALILSLFYKSIGTNQNIKNMVAAVMPIVSIMTSILLINFIKKAKDKFKNVELLFYVLLFMFLIYFIKINVVYVIIGIIFICFIVPKIEEKNLDKKNSDEWHNGEEK